MKMDATRKELRLAPAVEATLGALRRRIRRYIWIEGIAAAVAWLGAMFWASLAIDWLFEPPTGVRGVALALVGLGLAVVLIKLIGQRIFVPLTDGNMATVLERRFKQLDDTLLTAVVLTAHSPEQAGCNPAMLANTCQEAAQRVRGLELTQVFNPKPLRRKLSLAALLWVAILVFAVGWPAAMSIYCQRVLAFSDQAWPRNTHLVLPAFEKGPVKVASGGDVDIVVTAYTREKVVPETMEVRYRTDDGAHSRANMSRTGNIHADNKFEDYPWAINYTYTFRGVLASRTFDVIGGDDAKRGLKIQVVKSPTIEMALDRHYPEYMKRSDSSVPVTGVMQIPLGTQLTLHAKSNKELVQVQIDFPSDQKTAVRR